MAAPSLRIYSPAGVLRRAAPLARAARRLQAAGFDVSVDVSAGERMQRFAGSDEARLAAIHRTADACPSVALASRGGYGLTRLLDGIDWRRIADSVESGTRWVGHSDLTALQLGLLAHASGITWAGPLACSDFGATAAEGGVDDVTSACFAEAMDGSLEGIGFRTEAGFDGVDTSGRLWGGNLSIVCSMLGTPHLPKPSRLAGGILFLEDVNEHPYRVERCLLQLHQAGILGAQKAVVLGAFTEWRRSPNDRGYTLASTVARIRAASRVPVLTGLPFGHVQPKVCLPVGARVRLAVSGRDAFIAWGEL